MNKVILLITTILFSTGAFAGGPLSKPDVSKPDVSKPVLKPDFSKPTKLSPTVMAVIDPHLILTESKAAKSIREQIEKKRTEYQNQISTQEKDLNKKKQDLESLQGKISEDELSKKAQTFQAEVAKVQRSVQDKRLQMDQSYATAVSEIEKAVTSIIEKLASEKGFDVVIPSTHTMYSASQLNISSEVMMLLDAQLPKVNVVIK